MVTGRSHFGPAFGVALRAAEGASYFVSGLKRLFLALAKLDAEGFAAQGPAS